MLLKDKLYNLPNWLKSELKAYVVTTAEVSNTTYHNLLVAKRIKNVKVLEAIRLFLKRYKCETDVVSIMEKDFYLFLSNHQTITVSWKKSPTSSIPHCGVQS